jgi:hypothetical protein
LVRYFYVKSEDLNLRKRYFVITALIILLVVILNHAFIVNKTTSPVLHKSDLPGYLQKGSKIYSAPEVSGPATILPWEYDADFQKAMKDNNAYIQLANYCTVLKDPLPGEEINVHIAARLLKGTIVKPGKVFSQNAAIGPYSAYKGFQQGPVYIGFQLKSTVGGGVCKIASTLYNVAILSNLPVIERYNHSMPVPYVPLGQDATVCYGVKDLKFVNNTSYPLLIWAEGIDNRLYIGFYGQSIPPLVEWHHETLKQIKTWNVYRKNYDLKAGSEKVIAAGMDGAIVRTWLTIKNPRTGEIITKKLGKDYYNPMPAVVDLGIKQY